MNEFEIGKLLGQLLVEVDHLKSIVKPCNCSSSPETSNVSASNSKTVAQPLNDVALDFGNKMVANNANSYEFVLPKGKQMILEYVWNGGWEKRIKAQGENYFRDDGQYGNATGSGRFVERADHDRTFKFWAIFKCCKPAQPDASDCQHNHGWNDAICNVRENNEQKVHMTWSVYPHDPAQREMEVIAYLR